MLRVVPVRQTLRSSPVGDIRTAVRGQLAVAVPDAERLRGKKIAITAGSRGIDRIHEVVRAAVDTLREMGADPFIIPAMGSHGGGTDNGQREILRHLGITAESMGAQIRASIQTVDLGEAGGVPVRWAKRAFVNSDGVLVLNRVKPHTNFTGGIESGLLKMLTVGLGKREGARSIHNHARRLGMEQTIRLVGEHILATGKVVGGLALIEDGLHQLSEVRGVPVERFIDGDEEALVKAKELMPTLPFDTVDLLYVEVMGKNYSGSGLDPNIIGKKLGGEFRGFTLNRPHMTEVGVLVVSTLSKASGGNGVGFWFCDGVTQALADAIDPGVTQLNAETSFDPGFNTPMPPVYENDRVMLTEAIRRSGHGPGTVRAVFLHDTLRLSMFFVTEAMIQAVHASPGCEVIGDPQPLHFTDAGKLQLKWSFRR